MLLELGKVIARVYAWAWVVLYGKRLGWRVACTYRTHQRRWCDLVRIQVVRPGTLTFRDLWIAP